jgi:hypothetical protein
MKAVNRLMGGAAVVAFLALASAMPAKAQFGGGAGGEDMMTQMAPMLDMMKAKMGKKRFTMLMQTMGPMMSKMMDGGGGMGGGMGGLGGMMGGGSAMGFSDFGGGIGGGNIMGMMGSSEMMGMLPQMMSMANIGGGKSHRRARKHNR